MMQPKPHHKPNLLTLALTALGLAAVSGSLYAMLHTEEQEGGGHLYCVNHERAALNDGDNTWPLFIEGESLVGTMFAAADLDYGNWCNMLTGATWDNNDLHVMSISEA